MPSLTAYIGLADDGQLSLFVAPTKLAPWGTRLERKPFPAILREFYQMPLEKQEEACGVVLRSAQNYLEGKEAGAILAPVFGETTTKKTRKRS